MVKHFVAGLGGADSTIRAFRKKIYEDFRTEDDPDGVDRRYLYVDLNDELLMKRVDTNWKVLGRSVQLKKESQLFIKGMSLDKVLNDLPGSIRENPKGADACLSTRIT